MTDMAKVLEDALAEAGEVLKNLQAERDAAYQAGAEAMREAAAMAAMRHGNFYAAATIRSLPIPERQP